MPPSIFSQNSNSDLPFSWHRHAKLLPGLNNHRGKDVRHWTVEQVTEFVCSLPGCHDVAKTFKDEVSFGTFLAFLKGSFGLKWTRINYS